MQDYVIQIKGLSKNYGTFKAVNEVSFDVPRGCIFGLLGPNGAGKTSLIRMITTITQPDSGEIIFNGKPLQERDTDLMGYLPEERGLYKKMNVYDQLIFLARLKGMSKTDAKNKVNEWLNKMEISDWRSKLIQELSKGMQQKIQFIAAVINNPVFLILDEPFSGLDPINSSLIRNEIMELHDKGTTIILSTHRMEQVEEFCERIVLINQGRNVLNGEVSELRNRFKENVFDFTFVELPSQTDLESYNVIHSTANNVRLGLDNLREANIFMKNMIEKGYVISYMDEVLPSMNEIFIKQVKKG